MIVGFLIGAIVGAIGMFLAIRNKYIKTQK